MTPCFPGGEVVLSGHPSYSQAQSLSLPCRLHLLPVRLAMAADCKCSGSNEAPQLSFSSPPFNRCLTSPCGGMHLPASVISFKLRGKNITHQRSPATFLEENGHLNNIHIVRSELCSTSLSGEKKKKSPKTLIPGEVKRKLIFTIKFFYR